MAKKQSKLQTGARLPPALIDEVRRFAAERGMNISEVYAIAVNEYLARNAIPPSIDELARLVAAYLRDEAAIIQ